MSIAICTFTKVIKKRNDLPSNDLNGWTVKRFSKAGAGISRTKGDAGPKKGGTTWSIFKLQFFISCCAQSYTV